MAADTRIMLMGCHLKTDAIQAMESCIEDIRHWMVNDRLLLNDEKTEFLLYKVALVDN